MWLSLKIDKVAITHLAMEIYFQTSDHVVAVELVAEQHIGTKLCSCNTYIRYKPFTHFGYHQSSYYSVSYGVTAVKIHNTVYPKDR